MSDHRASKLCYRIDKVGRVLSKESTPVTSRLAMELVRGNLRATMSVTQSAMGNGSARVEVRKGRKVLYSAAGNYITDFFNWAEKGELTEDQWKLLEQA